MTQLMEPLDDLLGDVRQENLTYFTFAQSNKVTPKRVPAKAAAGTLPEVLAGRYRLERLLGAGGMGAVYCARDLLSEQFGDPDPYVALKILSSEFAESPDASALLYSEFALTRRLRHDNVLRVHTFEVDTDCQRAFITMELMRGLTLDQLLVERPLGLPWTELREIARALLDGLTFAHARGVLHGDIKPSNVMLSDEGVRLFDFGLGQAEPGILSGLPHLSRDRFKAWTPGYAAPELLDGQPLSARADVFSVACVLFELAGGQHPYRRLPSTEARDAHLQGPLLAPPNWPSHCWPALRTALSWKGGDRTISAAQLRDALGKPSWRQYLTVRRNRPV